METQKTETDEMLELATLYSNSVKTLVKEAIAELNIEQTCYCTLLSDDGDDTWTARTLDGTTTLSGLLNCTGRVLEKGGLVVVHYIGNDLSNGYIGRTIRKSVG